MYRRQLPRRYDVTCASTFREARHPPPPSNRSQSGMSGMSGMSGSAWRLRVARQPTARARARHAVTPKSHLRAPRGGSPRVPTDEWLDRVRALGAHPIPDPGSSPGGCGSSASHRVGNRSNAAAKVRSGVPPGQLPPITRAAGAGLRPPPTTQVVQGQQLVNRRLHPPVVRRVLSFTQTLPRPPDALVSCKQRTMRAFLRVAPISAPRNLACSARLSAPVRLWRPRLPRLTRRPSWTPSSVPTFRLGCLST